MKSYLIKTFGIIMVAALAGVTHFALGEKIDFAEELPPIQTTIGEPKAPNSNDEPAHDDNPQDPAQEQTSTDQQAEDTPFELTIEEMTLEREITTRQARYLFENDMAVFIDARPKATYEDGHIRDAFSLPTGAFDNGEPFAVSILNEDKYVVIYCSGGHCEESNFIAEDLAEYRPELEGLIHIYFDGYPGWTEAELPTLSGPDPFAE